MKLLGGVMNTETKDRELTRGAASGWHGAGCEGRSLALEA